jgi:hypothetical protein
LIWINPGGRASEGVDENASTPQWKTASSPNAAEFRCGSHCDPAECPQQLRFRLDSYHDAIVCKCQRRAQEQEQSLFNGELDLNQAEIICMHGQSGDMNTWIMVAWYIWVVVLVGTLLYLLILEPL